MDITTWSSVISTVGFPIVAYLLMYRMANETIRQNTKVLQSLKNEVEKLQETHNGKN